VSIHKRTTEGRGTTWVVRWRDPRPRERTFRTKVEAERFERRVLHSRDVGVYRDPALDRVTFREWHDRWWPTIEASREPNTVAQYECILRRHVLPELGDCRLASLEKIDLEEWIAELRARGVGASAIRTARTLAGMVLRSAVESKVIPYNPATGLRLSRAPGRSKRALTAAQVETLVAAFDPHWRPLVLVLAYGGLRPGEALALRRRHLTDLGQLLIEQGQTEVRGHLRTADTKTHRARVVPLAVSVLAALQDHLGASTGHSPEDRIFSTPNGAPVRLSNFRGTFERARRDVGLPEWTTPYTLRHTAASLLAQRGVPPSTAAAMLGHDPAVFLRTYAHLYPEDLSVAAHALEGARREASQALRKATVLHRKG